jgi:hypothetical protein
MPEGEGTDQSNEGMQVQLQIDHQTDLETVNSDSTDSGERMMYQDGVDLATGGRTDIQIEGDFMEGEQPMEPVTTRNEERNVRTTRSGRVMKRPKYLDEYVVYECIQDSYTEWEVPSEGLQRSGYDVLSRDFKTRGQIPVHKSDGERD